MDAKERHLKNQATLLRLKNKIMDSNDLVTEIKRLKMENEIIQSQADQRERISIFEKQKSVELLQKLEKSVEEHQV